MWANPEFVPKWKTKDTSPEITSYTPTCIFRECHERKKLISPKFDSVENCELAIGVKSSPETPFLLCSKHYAVLYRQLNTSQPCANCGDLNDLIHAEITKQSGDQIYVQNDLHELNIDQKISMVDPQLWNGNRCGPGCQCQGCRNARIANTCTDENLSESENESEDNSSSDEECVMTEIVMEFNEIIYSATNIADT